MTEKQKELLKSIKEISEARRYSTQQTPISRESWDAVLSMVEDFEAEEVKNSITEGNVFVVDGEEFVIRHITKCRNCLLEKVIHRNANHFVTGGLNKVMHIDKLLMYEQVV